MPSNVLLDDVITGFNIHVPCIAFDCRMHVHGSPQDAEQARLGSYLALAGPTSSSNDELAVSAEAGMTYLALAGQIGRAHV